VERDLVLSNREIVHSEGVGVGAAADAPLGAENADADDGMFRIDLRKWEYGGIRVVVLGFITPFQNKGESFVRRVVVICQKRRNQVKRNEGGPMFAQCQSKCGLLSCFAKSNSILCNSQILRTNNIADITTPSPAPMSAAVLFANGIKQW